MVLLGTAMPIVGLASDTPPTAPRNKKEAIARRVAALLREMPPGLDHANDGILPSELTTAMKAVRRAADEPLLAKGKGRKSTKKSCGRPVCA